MSPMVMRADVDGVSRPLGSYTTYVDALDAVMSNGWIPRGAAWRVAGALHAPPGLDGSRRDPFFAALIVENGDEEFVLAIVHGPDARS